MFREPFVEGEFYHVYNHGVEKRDIFSDEYDTQRFLDSMRIFNSEEPIGSIYEQSFNHDLKLDGETAKSKLVNIVAYCLNPNHFHLLLEQVSEKGISEFMKRLGGGYTWYFNNRNKRRGNLFQGVFRSSHVTTNEYLLHVSAYINLNYRVHQLGGETAKLIKSSWEEYTGKVVDPRCSKAIILGQFRNKSEYKEYSEDALPIMLDRKKSEREEKHLMIE
ncbi:MAG: transposase [Candidatus Paceibacterota bacterium]|jgi:REP element-mobilizing transposase RayT